MADKDTKTLMNHLQLFQNRAAKATLGLPPCSSATICIKSAEPLIVNRNTFSSSMFNGAQVP